MGIREEESQKVKTVKATSLETGDTFKIIKGREPYIVSKWEDEDEDLIPIAVSLLTGKAIYLDHFDLVIPTNFVITEDI